MIIFQFIILYSKKIIENAMLQLPRVQGDAIRCFIFILYAFFDW